MIRDELDGLTGPMLSQRLKELACHGLVERAVEPTTPPTTTYSLTEQGSEITAHLRELESLVELRDDATQQQCVDEFENCRNEALDDGCLTVSDC